MTKKEIQQIMAIVRPAIIAVYGRQPLKLVTYQIMSRDIGYTPHSYMWLQVDNPISGKPYTVNLERGKVSYLKQRELNG